MQRNLTSTSLKQFYKIIRHTFSFVKKWRSDNVASHICGVILTFYVQPTTGSGGIASSERTSVRSSVVRPSVNTYFGDAIYIYFSERISMTLVTNIHRVDGFSRSEVKGQGHGQNL